MSRREIEREARESGPWTDYETTLIRALRELPSLTPAQLRALRVLRQREINECVRLRRSA